MVPFTPGSTLRDMMQDADKNYCSMIRSRPIRIMEKGGDKLINILGRNDPWANSRVCDDDSCPTCMTQTWLKEEKKQAKKDKQDLPEQLLQKTSHQCRREGSNYTIQCITCIPLGRQSLYRGETSRSTRQRHLEHFRDIESGLVSSPFVTHSLEEHGGEKPSVIYLIDQIESRPLYRVARESVKIANMPWGPEKLNKCMEWGAPRVPVLSAEGGDGHALLPGQHNPRVEWTKKILKKIEDGSMKRIRYWQQEDNQLSEDVSHPLPTILDPLPAPPRPKKRRMNAPHLQITPPPPTSYQGYSLHSNHHY